MLVAISLILSSCGGEAENVEPLLEPFVAKCEEPMPEFTLGRSSNPPAERVTELCGCIWNHLGDWEKETSRAISEGREADVSSLNMAAFPNRFGGAIQSCGGMNL